MTGHEKTFTQPERKEAPMRHTFDERPLGLYLLAALAAAFILVPVASASAAIDTHITIEGSGSGNVAGVEPAPGKPPIACEWNGKAQTGTCDTEAQKTAVLPLPTIEVHQEAAPGSKFVKWTVEKGTELFESCTSYGECNVIKTGTEIKIKATFESSGPPSIPLTINQPGSGSGQVNCQVIGGALDEPCEASYPEGTELELIAAAGEGSEFEGFENATGSAEPCEAEGSPCGPFTLEEASEVDAIFALETRELEIEEEGPGTVEVQCKEGASFTACANPLSELDYGTEVKLTAIPDTGAEIESVSGTGSATSCTASPCTFTLSEDSEVSAVFVLETFALTIETTGEGSVEAECDEGSGFGPCAPLSELPYGTEVKLEAEAETGWEFAAWSGDCDSVTGNECELEIDAAKTVEASFVLAGQKSLAIDTSTGTGTGSVNCEVNGGPTLDQPCKAAYTEGTELKLIPAPASHTEFAGYNTGTGSISCTGKASCQFTINANSSVNAPFTKITHTIAITPAGNGSGTVECKFGAGSFGSCAGPHNEGEAVEVKATAALHSSFTGFSAGSGSASGCTTSPCSFNLESDSALTATFTKITHTITITPAGNGSGTVECKFGAGSFGSCAGPHNEGEAVEVKATAALHSSFTGFSAGSGSASGCTTSPCSFNLESDSALTATFTKITHTLTITPAGNGTGTVECKFGAGSFGSCAGPHNEGEAVEVKATAALHSSFTGFSAGSGSASGCTTSPCSFNLESDSALTATFTKITHTIAITPAGNGSGTVECKFGAGSFGSCAGPHNEGEAVEVKGTAALHSSFGGWSAGSGSAASCTGTANCSFNLEANSALTATFTKITHTLTATVTGPGSVSAGASPAPVSGAISACKEAAGSCTATYNEADTVTLTATPGAHQQIAWGGCDSHTATTCTVAVGANTTITETETTILHTLTVNKAGSGSGTVTCNGTTCASTYPEGTEVTLAATAASGSSFAGWSGGGCSGTGSCKVTLNADTTVTATFDKEASGGGGGGTGGGGGGTPPPPPPPPAQCVVPKLKGKTLGQAKSALRAAQCALGKVTKPKKAKGALVVKSSSPGPGKALAAGSKVNLKLGPKPKKKKKKG